MKARKTEKSAAILTIHGPGKMTATGRKAIIAWLRQAAKNLDKHGALYTEGRFTARYLYV